MGLAEQSEKLKGVILQDSAAASTEMAPQNFGNHISSASETFFEQKLTA